MSRGLVRFGPTVRAKMTEKTIGAALTLKGGDKLETALRTALVYAAWLEHGGRQIALGSAA
jgi:hypothetical protein